MHVQPTTSRNASTFIFRRIPAIAAPFLLLLMMAGAISLPTTVLTGCQERVVDRRGIGADESNPTVSERASSDRLSDYIWPDDKKKN